jgi:hypothetical protein
VQVDSVDSTPRGMSGDAMALGRGRKGGGTVVWRNRRVDGSVVGIPLAMTHGRGAGEIWGKAAPTGGA